MGYMTQRRLHLVRHGRPAMVRGVFPHDWRLDPTGLSAIDALRESGRLPERGAWYSSPEPKAIETARRLTDQPVAVVEGLREHVRQSAVWLDDFEGTVRRAFADMQASAVAGWEPLATARGRLLPAVRSILKHHVTDDVVLVGHGTAWTLLASELTHRPPDLDAWARLQMPDLWSFDLP